MPVQEQFSWTASAYLGTLRNWLKISVSGALQPAVLEFVNLWLCLSHLRKRMILNEIYILSRLIQLWHALCIVSSV